MKNEERRDKFAISAHFRKAGPHKDAFSKKPQRREARKSERFNQTKNLKYDKLDELE
jgi:hypothetical protein